MSPKRYTKSESCQAHCTLCNLCFASLMAFDAHLRPNRLKRKHRKPHKVVALRIRTEEGLCTVSYQDAPMTGRVTGRTIWEHGEQTDAARERFADMRRKAK